jgi:hypothetical protein
MLTLTTLIDHAQSYDTASLEVPTQGISYPPQGSQSFQDTTAGTSTSEVMLIQLGEIPHTEVMKMAMRLVTRELFGENAMSTDKTAKKNMLTQVIWDSVPCCFGPNGEITPHSLASV